MSKLISHIEDTRSANVLENVKVALFICIGVVFIGLAFVFNSPYEIWAGYIEILTSSADLITDYIELSNIGATFLNVGIMLLMSLLMVKINGQEINGLMIAAIFTVTGFSFFGKNIFNTIPITFGVFLSAKMEYLPFRRYLAQALFGTGLSPLVSEISFNLGLPMGQGIILGVAAGIIAGFVIPPLAANFSNFHHGFNLYNIGFTVGIVGMFFIAIIRSMGIEIQAVSIISSGNNNVFATIFYSLFAIMFLIGLCINDWSLKGYFSLLSLTGRSGTDFTVTSGFGLTMINMSFLGCLATSYVLAMGGELNGPTIGAILTVVGFGAYGKHMKNVIPIIIGVFIAKSFNMYEHSSTLAILVALFGTTLAPIAGHYGVVAGIIAGFIHMAVTMNIGYLHGGMNLYNNGFSGGFIAAAFVPFLDAIIRFRESRRKQ